MKAFCQIYAQWDQLGEHIDAEARHLLGLGLVCDTTFGFAQADRKLAVLRAVRDAGGLCAPNIYPRSLDPGNPACRDSNWWKYPQEECARLLERAQGQYAALGLGPMEAVNTYTPGNAFVAACRRAGVRYLLGFCAPEVGEDGGWELAHYGSPLTPYFIGDEDFRKPENPLGRADGRTEGLLMSSMELRNPMACLHHWNEGPWCPLNAQAADRWLEPSGQPLPFLQIAGDWLRQAELTGRPLFFHLNLQYFFAGRCREHNRRALEWLAEERDRGRLEVGGLRQWRERMLADGAGGLPPQRTYWRGEMMGSHTGNRPGAYPDVVVEESLRGQSVWMSPHPLPVRLYDYTQPWSYPAFDPTGAAPASADFSAIAVPQWRRAGPESAAGRAGEPWAEYEVTLQNSGPRRRVAVMCWEMLRGEAPWQTVAQTPGWGAEPVPHPTGEGGAVRLEGELPPGETIVRLAVGGRRAGRAQPTRRTWGGEAALVTAETFLWRGRPYTVLASQVPDAFALLAEIHRPPGEREPVIVESLQGIEHTRCPLEGTQTALRFDGSRLANWHRIWGVGAWQITLHGAAETVARLRRETAGLAETLAPGLREELAKEAAWQGALPENPAPAPVPAPGFQRFGNLRDAGREAAFYRALGRAAGREELRRMTEWFRALRPAKETGEVVVEAHPGLFLPRGSITKTLGHEFDHIRCAPGHEFREFCADYPQSWGWGIGAWVQWRHLNVGIRGLGGSPGGPAPRHTLHLHAFDPEGRGLVQRVHFFNPEAAGSADAADLCAVREWALPAGGAGRWEPGALCSVPIPAACLKWPTLGVWVSPLEKQKLHDWVAEQGAPGLFCHLWVTRKEASPG